ncbi:MAG: hypothetical protein EBZ05_08705 [Verrucomicrobia bacterium]|nr:hypothetical protein [Verrucomicrobiota bacterium]
MMFSAFLAGGMAWANGGGNDPYSAERYYSSPQKFVGEKVKVRVFKIEPRPSLTAADLGYVWFQATTDREGTEAFKIHLRVEQEEAEKFARNFQTESRIGRLVDGIFGSRSSSTDLSRDIATQVPFFLTIGERAEIQQATGEVISGSLVVTPSPKKADKTEKIPLVAVPVSEPKTAVFSGPKWCGVLPAAPRSGPGGDQGRCGGNVGPRRFPAVGHREEQCGRGVAGPDAGSQPGEGGPGGGAV